jgi:hypothetical protein
MTPKEKAKELFDKMWLNLPTQYGYLYCKQCALIAVDENVKMLKQILNESTDIYQSLNTPKKLCIDLLNPLLKYWKEVKKEIELL